MVTFENKVQDNPQPSQSMLGFPDQCSSFEVGCTITFTQNSDEGVEINTQDFLVEGVLCIPSHVFEPDFLVACHVM